MDKTREPEAVTASKNPVVEGEAYTVLSLCEDLSTAEEEVMWSDGSCCACPSYTTVPCQC